MKIITKSAGLFCASMMCFVLSPRALAQTSAIALAVARSDIALDQPNTLATQAVGLGNGRLGAAFGAADGLTLQLNRADGLPYRRSPGQVVLPDLKAMTADRGFKGRLNLYDGTLEESGGGITLKAWVDRASDRVIIDLAGLPADKRQHIRLQLWEPRKPIATIQDGIALLAESWRDDQLPGASGLRFGTLSAIQAIGRDPQAKVLDTRTVEVTALPTVDGHLRVVVAAPSFHDERAAVDSVRDTLSPAIDLRGTTNGWHVFWAHADAIEADSTDGIARYAETLRTLYLFDSAAHSGGDIPGSQAGIADLFSSSKDDHFWDPAAFWFWNLRMQVGANLAAGLPEPNEPIFALYRNHLDEIRQWTREHMGGRPGICVPETMRFNGNGVEYESDRFRPFAIITHSCDQAWSASSNARTLSTGAEIGLWVWRTYQQTRNVAFLAQNYPLMAESARFLLAYQKPGKDGMLHTSPSNAHETQMDVTDPATDISAIHALYPATIAAAKILGRDADLAVQLQHALQRTPPLPLMPANASLGATRATDQVLAASYEPSSPYQNGENIGLEPVWPYQLIGIDDPLFPVARRTYAQRPFVYAATWSYDPVQAARLGLGSDVAKAIFHLTQLYQVYPNGMAALIAGPPNEFYMEQAGVVALTLSEVLAVQDPDGLVRVGPSIPPGWTMSGRVSMAHGIIVSVDVINGRLTAFTLHAADDSPIAIATPWLARSIQVLENGKPFMSIVNGRFTFIPKAGVDYRFELAGGNRRPVFTSDPSAHVKVLGRAAIGLGPPCCATPPGYDIRSDLRGVDDHVSEDHP